MDAKKAIKSFLDESEFLHSQGHDDSLCYDTPPLRFELVPIGIYNGVDLPDDVVLDDSYTVYLETPNPEYNCEVIMN